MRFGAGTVIAKKFGAGEIVDPRAFAVGSIAGTYETYPGIGALLPAMGYSDQQVRDLEATIDRVPCDVVIVGTPIDLSRLVKIRKPVVRARSTGGDHPTWRTRDDFLDGARYRTYLAKRGGDGHGGRRS
jgi:predicted GTPase